MNQGGAAAACSDFLCPHGLASSSQLVLVGNGCQSSDDASKSHYLFGDNRLAACADPPSSGWATRWARSLTPGVQVRDLSRAQSRPHRPPGGLRPAGTTTAFLRRREGCVSGPRDQHRTPPVEANRRHGGIAKRVEEPFQLVTQGPVGLQAIAPRGYGDKQELEQLAQQVIPVVDPQAGIVLLKARIALLRHGEVDCRSNARSNPGDAAV